MRLCPFPHHLVHLISYSPGSTATTSIPAPTSAIPSQPTSFDPFGEGGEGDQSVGALIDGDVGTTWQTERYLDPLDLLKPGVGVTVRMSGTPVELEIVKETDAGLVITGKIGMHTSPPFADDVYIGALSGVASGA